ncbi:MAG: PLP-dependent aminotransferase family protein [Anaerolineae bacterium]|jgi:DNA-binding transcriptional MocR family regulator|nr:PLP-dependent aminotransferase family protein [Anaerolineae bacterium]
MDAAGTHKYEQVASEIARLIDSGTFRPGDAIPSVRELSRQHGVSIATVVQAYYLLEAQGLIEARDRSGFYVRTARPSALPEPDISAPRSDPTGVSVRDVVAEVSLADTRHPNLVQLGAAHPNTSLGAPTALTRIQASVARRMGHRIGMYDYVPGCEPLRVQIAQRALSSGCRLSPDDVIITTGCTESINLCLRAVCRPGDTVAIESPTGFDALLSLDVLGLQALEIPTHPRDGISLDALRFALDHHRVSACLVVTNYNNPLGSCMPDDHKRDLVDLLAARDIPLIENDIFGEIHFQDRRPNVAKAYDRKGLVMLCSSFSKSLCPGFRVGWVVPGRFMPAIRWLKYTTSLASPTLSEYAIAEFVASGSYDPYIRRIRRTYERYVGALSDAVRRFFPPECRLTRPGGGFLLWVQLPERIDSLDLYRRALSAGIAITPGYLFSPTNQYRNFIRLNAANWSDETLPALRTLAALIGQ